MVFKERSRSEPAHKLPWLNDIPILIATGEVTTKTLCHPLDLVAARLLALPAVLCFRPLTAGSRYAWTQGDSS